jgi:protein arginine N-methyltransferase 1
VNKSGTAPGFYLWFKTELTRGVGYTSGPEALVSSYDSAFFPFSEPIEVVKGETITIDLRAKLLGDDYLWCWNTKTKNSSSPIEFKQSSFYSDLIPVAQIQKQYGLG